MTPLSEQLRAVARLLELHDIDNLTAAGRCRDMAAQASTLEAQHANGLSHERPTFEHKPDAKAQESTR